MKRWFCRYCSKRWTSLFDERPDACPECSERWFDKGPLRRKAIKRLGEKIISYKKRIGWYNGK